MDIEVQTLRDTRQGILIATFVDGYAAGWRMAVPEAFKAALDIQYTEKTITAGEGPDGKPREFKEYQWTQGRSFAFSAGDTIYDCRDPGGTWADMLKVMVVGFKVLQASSGEWVLSKRVATLSDVELRWTPKTASSEPDSTNLNIVWKRWSSGKLKFQVLRPNAERTKIEFHEIYETDQELFVTLLQTGILWAKGSQPVRFIENCAVKGVQKDFAQREHFFNACVSSAREGQKPAGTLF